MKRALLLAIIPALLLQQGAPTVAQTPDALGFFKNYFITGDYAVGGVGLRNLGVNGIATGSIPIAGVPERVDVLAAFLYWQVVTKGTSGFGLGQRRRHLPRLPAQRRRHRAIRQSARLRNAALLELRRRHRTFGRYEPDLHLPR